MPTTKSNGTQTPVNADTFNLTGDLGTMAESITSVVSVANQAAGDTVATNRAAAGFSVTDAKPLFCWDQSQNALIVKGSAGWRGGVKPFGHMGRTAGFQTMDTTSNGGAGPIVGMAAAQQLRGNMTFDAANNALVLPLTGTYEIRMQVYASGSATGPVRGRFWKIGSGIIGPTVQFSKADATNDYVGSAVAEMPFTAGDKLAVVVNYSASTWGSSGYDGTFLEVKYSDQW